jgi:arylsulfatase
MMKKRPNLLLITTDQQRGDCLGSDGNPVVETPYLDELAAGGCRFRNAFSAVPSCIPARAAILTGMDQWNHGRLAMTGKDFLEYPATLPGELTRAGYQTRAVGKMHFQPQRAHYGFEHMVLDESSRREGKFVSDYHQWLDETGEDRTGYRDHSIAWNSWVAKPTSLPGHLHPTAWTAAESVRFFKNRDETRPFFLWMSFARPHSPYDAPQWYTDLYLQKPDLPAPLEDNWSEEYKARAWNTNAGNGTIPPDQLRRARAGYYGNITFIDHQIGRVLWELRRQDPEAAANTLVVFTSDHGDMLGDHHLWRKGLPYQGSLRIPLLVRLPETWRAPREQVDAQPVELQDILPTMLEAAGVEIPSTVTGRSLLSTARGGESVVREELLCEQNRGDATGWQCLTNGREKFIWFHHTGAEQYFDLENDPGETRNLAADPQFASRIAYWRERLACVNEQRGDSRGQGGRLIPWSDKDPNDPALSLTPNYWKWKKAGEEKRKANFE